ncbi:MAG: DMT family transporter [Erysipelotrichaceae bacterium]|nr:DMT family transporter [Erysipelotrichaceae bacterium]
MRTGKERLGEAMLLICAMIWGGAFIAQSAGMDYIRPFTYSACRFYVGCLSILPLLLISSRKDSDEVKKKSIIGGIVCGIFLFLGNSFQQYGLTMTSPGKAGFISALYLVFVPLMTAIIFHKKIEKHVILAILIAVTGFYFLCIKGDFSIQMGDLMVLGCAFCFTFQIMGVDYFARFDIDVVMLSFFQFLTTAIISTVFMFIFDDINIADIIDAKWTILYAGVLSSGVAYTFQVYGQRVVDSTVASLLMSLESVFSVLFEWLILHTSMSPVELFGCLLVFIAVIIVQLPSKKEELNV